VIAIKEVNWQPFGPEFTSRVRSSWRSGRKADLKDIGYLRAGAKDMPDTVGWMDILSARARSNI